MADVIGITEELQNLSDQVWERTSDRLRFLTDDEYFWEPVPGCWSIRRHDDGRWHADAQVERQDPPPFTTIAWRLWHLIDLHGENRAPQWLGVEPQGEPLGLDGSRPPPSTAAGALELLELAHARWDAHLALADDALLSERLGAVAGPFADHTKGAYVLHMLDEFIHHGAEVALLRDLWRAQLPT